MVTVVDVTEHVRGSRLDPVLCDVGMPEVNGWEVAEWIREIAPNDPHRKLVAGVLPKPLALDTVARLLGAEAR